MVTASASYVEALREEYRSGGATRVGFATARHLASRTLPPPYGTRAQVGIELFEEALTSLAASSLPLHRHLDTYRRGFDEQQYHLYEFGSGSTDPTDYVSKYARKCARGINEDPSLLRDKERFQTFLAEHGFDRHLPDRYGRIRHATFETDLALGLRALVEREDRIVVKEAIGGGGNAVYIGERDGTDVRLVGKGGASRSIGSAMEAIDRGIVTEYCDQAEYVDEIYPHAANTIRLLAMDPPGDPPFIAAAAHRIGTDATRPLDNFSQGAGGLSAEIDVDTGELGPGATLSGDDELQWHERHPETDTQIDGVRVPGWESVVEAVRELMAATPSVAYAGWDIIVTAPEEFTIVEGNHYPGPAVHQVHRPLLPDRRVRSFYDHHDVPI